MRTTTLTTAGIFTAIAAHAQNSGDAPSPPSTQRISPTNTTSSFSYMNITFSTSSQENCNTRDPAAPANDPNEISISINIPPTISACFNLNDTFSRPDFAVASRTGIQYTLLYDPTTFDPNESYTGLSYIQRIGPSFAPPQNDSQTTHGPLSLTTYNAENCQSRVKDNDGDGEEGMDPWNMWDCTSPLAECADLTYGVRSFRVAPVDEDRAARGCVRGAEFGNEEQGTARTSGAGRVGAGFVSLVGGVLGVMLLSMDF